MQNTYGKLEHANGRLATVTCMYVCMFVCVYGDIHIQQQGNVTFSKHQNRKLGRTLKEAVLAFIVGAFVALEHRHTSIDDLGLFCAGVRTEGNVI
jgi:hypothetical protein